MTLKHNVIKHFFQLILYLLTLPVTAASCERAHSKVSLVKSVVRASINADRLEDLVFISSEKTRPIQSNFQQLLTDLPLINRKFFATLNLCAMVLFACFIVYFVSLLLW